MKLTFRKALSIHLAAAAAVIIYLILPFKCPIKHFLGFDCPTCGMTRAFFALAKGDISASLKFNPIAVPFLLLFLFALHKDLFRFSDRTKNIIIITGAFITFFVYILKLIY